MKRKHKQYSRPKRPFDKTRIDEEAKIKEAYGLKNKREIWRAESKIRIMRRKAKRLIKADKEEQEVLFQRLQRRGFEINSIADILGLDRTDYLKRRLQTIVFNKKLAPTKKVLVDGKIINIPSYLVPIKLEDKITIKKTIKNPKEKKEDAKEE